MISHELITHAVDLSPLAIPLLMAFSKKTRKIIRERDHNQSVWSGKTENLECAHVTHDKSDPRYDDPSNGRLLTTAEHMWDHINREGRNGLTKEANDWAIIMIWKRFWGLID